ncbi:unnamed protein product [Protopolystoma xenopodis]|uniref:Uncharacterized protein n=1 Tax=Protopolystoma xenopodis TaxID=117903 RepID=A0A3S5BRF5_9PLAT|nr:unnamed protein product [Protopolystoma xenopodis]
MGHSSMSEKKEKTDPESAQLSSRVGHEEIEKSGHRNGCSQSVLGWSRSLHSRSFDYSLLYRSTGFRACRPEPLVSHSGASCLLQLARCSPVPLAHAAGIQRLHSGPSVTHHCMSQIYFRPLPYRSIVYIDRSVVEYRRRFVLKTLFLNS